MQTFHGKKLTRAGDNEQRHPATVARTQDIAQERSAQQSQPLEVEPSGEDKLDQERQSTKCKVNEKDEELEHHHDIVGVR